LKRKKTTPLPGVGNILKTLGQHIKLARKRRSLTQVKLADQADIARSTLQLIENGSPGVSMTSYLQVLFLLGMGKDLQLIGSYDLRGRKLQDEELLAGKSKPARPS
jgi:DNA-binding XRE family transcriptional regulator